MHAKDLNDVFDDIVADAEFGDAPYKQVTSRGRRRIRLRRSALVSVLVLVAAVALSAAKLRGHSTPDTASTPTLGQPVVPARDVPPGPTTIASGSEAWECGNPIVYYTNDSGTTWRHVPLPNNAETGWTCIGEAVPGGNAWTYTASGSGLVRIRHLTDIQAFPLPKIGTDNNRELRFVDPNHGWLLVGPLGTGALVGTATLYRTNDGGATWDEIGQPPNGALYVETGNQPWIVYQSRQVFATADGGATWRMVTLPAPQHGAHDLIRHWQVNRAGDTVVVWSAIRSDTSQRLIDFFDVSADGGRTWSIRPGPAGFEPPNSISNTFAVADPTHWWLASGSTLRITSDAGRTWHAAPDLPFPKGYGGTLSANTPNIGWVVESNGTFHTADGARTWTAATADHNPQTATAP